MKYLLLCLLLSISAPTAKLIKYKGAKGYIFDAGYEPGMIASAKQRYTPNEQDIHLAEDILRQKIKKYNIEKGHPNQSSTPVIHSHLNRYIRQYIGYVTNNGDKVIWINCVWGKKLEKGLSEEITKVMDGGSYYWSIEVDITTGTLFNLRKWLCLK